MVARMSEMELGLQTEAAAALGDATPMMAQYLALKAAHTVDVALAYQMLIYPCVDMSFERQ